VRALNALVSLNNYVPYLGFNLLDFWFLNFVLYLYLQTTSELGVICCMCVDWCYISNNNCS